MRAPDFWSKDNWQSRALVPAAWVYGAVQRWNFARGKTHRVSVPVVCIGNLVAGGAGKTPTALALAELLSTHFARPMFLSRGYGGKLAGPVMVDPLLHSARDVGDEALLLAARRPTVVAWNRVAGANFAAQHGADIILMDDGFQNAALHKNVSVVVIDGGFGFGNGRLIPAGPLRETIAAGLARTDAVVMVGADARHIAASLPPTLSCFYASLEPISDTLKGARVVGFAGIGRPEKFHATLQDMGCDVANMLSFADHHVFTARELKNLAQMAVDCAAQLVTTRKDYVRLPTDFQAQVQVVDVKLKFDDAGGVQELILQRLHAHTAIGKTDR